MLDEFFNEQGICITIHMATETVVDPFEKNVELTDLPAIKIRGIVTDLIASQVQWKMPGIVTHKAKEVLVDKKHLNLIEHSYKIGIKGELYDGWKVNGRMQIREEGDFLRLYVYIKKES